jgi:hypothetical protein
VLDRIDTRIMQAELLDRPECYLEAYRNALCSAAP